MKKYYTRVCNFYYGDISKRFVQQKKTLPLHGNKHISFDQIEILSRNSSKKVHIKYIKKLPNHLKKKVYKDLYLIKKKKKNFSNFNFKNYPNFLGVLNLTPDSFSDGGKFTKGNLGYKHALNLIKFGARAIDVGGESTRPGSKEIKTNIEWNRINSVIKKLAKKITISLDTRKSEIMKKGIKNGVRLINDISGLSDDKKKINILLKHNTPFVIHHIQGTPETMQVKPKYKNVLLDIYDYFEEKIKYLKSIGINHNKIVIDPGIGFGKNLKHNMKLIQNVSIFHSLGYPIMLGISRKRFIKDISKNNDSEERIGGTISSSIFSIMQGVQILRVHDVNEIMQAVKVFKKLYKN